MRYSIPRKLRPSEKKFFVAGIPDLHTGYIIDTPTYCPGAWDVALQVIQYYADRLTHVVIGGDFGNWEGLSHWASLRADQAFIEEDIALVCARLAELTEIIDPHGVELAFCEGNHEAWAGLYEAKYPAGRDTYNLKRRLGFHRKKHRTWVPENYFYALGELYFTHGHLRGVRSPIDMVRKKGVSVAYFHTHAYRTESVRNLTGEHAAWTCGTLASIDPPPPYAKGEPPETWVHGMPLAQVRANGRFQLGFRRIIDEAWVELEDGTEIIADPKSIRARLALDAKIRRDLRKEYSEKYWVPGGAVIRPEPHYGKTRINNAVARTRRARIVRTLPDAR